jgi:3-oxoacyl-(acyl-carrier-protein) synthase
MASGVVITGLGVVSSLGKGLGSNREALLEGRRRMASPTLFQVAGGDPSPVAEIPSDLGFEPLPGRLGRYDSREARIAAAACAEAFASSGALEACGRDIALMVGTTSSGVHGLEECWREYRATGSTSRSWDFANQHLAGAVARAMTKHFGLRGPHTTVSTACSSSANAMILAALGIRRGRFKAAAVLGADTISEMVYYGFGSLGLVSPFPTTPFDEGRKGLTLGEAAACLVLEDETSARARGARIHARLLGFGMSSDAHSITAPDPEGVGVRRCMTMALENAGIGPGRVDAINAHGTGTQQNDEVEGRAIGEIFGPDVPVTSTKSFTGHTLGAAGAIEAVFSILSITDGFVPPTVGTARVSPSMGIRVVTGAALRKACRTVLSTSFGFGGSNAALVFGAAEGGPE